jgi:hypothetical protein
MFASFDDDSAEMAQPGVSFMGHPLNANLLRLALHHPEFHFDVIHAIKVRVDDPADREIIQSQDNDGHQAWVWWIAVSPTGQDASFRPDGEFGTHLRLPHYILADEVSVAVAVAQRDAVAADPSLDRVAQRDVDPHNTEDLDPDDLRMLAAQLNYGERVWHFGALNLRGLEPSAVIDSVEELEDDDDIDYVSKGADACDLATQGAQAWAREVRKQWWSDKSVNPLDPNAAFDVMQRMYQGEWLGQLDSYWFGIGMCVSESDVARALGADEFETSLVFERYSSAKMVVSLPVLDLDKYGDLLVEAVYLPTATWRPTRDWWTIVDPEDMVQMFAIEDLDTVREIVGDCYAAARVPCSDQDFDQALIRLTASYGKQHPGTDADNGFGL